MPRSALPDLPLSRHAVDRDHVARTQPDLFDRLWENPSTRLLVLWKGKALVTTGRPGPLPEPSSDPFQTIQAQTDGAANDEADGSSPEPFRLRLDLVPVERSTSALVRVYLGRTLAATDSIGLDAPVVLVTVTDAAAGEIEPDETHWRGLREVGPSLDDLDAGLFTEALGISLWHESHLHCPRCGSPTVVESGGWVRRCLEEGREIFPRTDPAVIMGIVDTDDRILLGSNAMWAGNRWSLLAGFVEPGESFETAVAREVFEEAGVRVVDAQYLGSQPWPFPASVMVGFTARLADGQHVDDLHPDGEEILALRWFSRDDLWAQREEIALPGAVSIARAILENWYGGPLVEPPPEPGVASVGAS